MQYWFWHSFLIYNHKNNLFSFHYTPLVQIFGGSSRLLQDVIRRKPGSFVTPLRVLDSLATSAWQPSIGVELNLRCNNVKLHAQIVLTQLRLWGVPCLYCLMTHSSSALSNRSVLILAINWRQTSPLVALGWNLSFLPSFLCSTPHKTCSGRWCHRENQLHVKGLFSACSCRCWGIVNVAIRSRFPTHVVNWGS